MKAMYQYKRELAESFGVKDTYGPRKLCTDLKTQIPKVSVKEKKENWWHTL